MTGQAKRATAALVVAAAAALFSADAAAQDPFDFLFGGGYDGPRRARRAPSAPRRSERPPPRKRDGAAQTQTKGQNQQAPGAPAATGAPAAPSGPEGPPPPYDPQITRLSEVLGALAFLRDLCGSGDGEEWRGKMSALLDADAPSGARRQRLMASFNHGFRGYELTYRACTPNAKTVISRYLAEASRLTRDITYRYGNP
ncbi:TIGR02301 family protein [Methylocystis sp. SB2]|uniref:TIGR02301 family protein n=1 Tax=Methylocystis sp. (strain SB2) TaxID=743836 RepID=UPI0004202560|nr:TIGR02301 family protein [Methylocystis sp. SB2]ULO22440.1 TIGR02301 family protein [Methylocystis sp. SB2]